MSLFDSLSSEFSSAFSGDPATLLQHATQLINAQEGGLQGLLAQCQSAGLSEHVASWLGSSGNLPISAEQLQSALGDGPIAAFAQKLGLPTDQAAAHLANLLPGIADHASPDGQVDNQAILDEGVAALKAKLFG